MAYNSTIDKDTDDILIYGNTAKDGSGTDYVPLLDADGHTQVDVLTNALPTGASTLAEQQSQTTHLNTIAGDTTSIQTSVELIDDTVATDGAATPTKGILMAGQDGTNAQTLKTDASGELQVDVLTMPTTTVTATDLDIRNLVNTDVVTAELSATDNAVLDAIAASTAAIDTDTTTIIGHLDGVEGLLTTIDADTGSILTSVDGIETLIGTTNTTLTTIDGRVDGLETSNSAIQTAVELLDDTVQVLGTATYTEAASKGITIGAVRRDADTTLVNTTNEFSPLQVDANGRLKVEAFSGETLPVSLASVPSHAVTNAGTFVVQENGAALTALQLIDDAIRVEDAAETAGTGLMMAGTVRRDTAASSAGTAGDNATLNTDATGRLWTSGTVTEDVAHSAGETLNGNAVRRIDTPATSAGTSGDWATMDASAEGALWVTQTPTTTGGLTIHKTDALVATAVAVKASAGNVYGYHIFNPNTADIYVHIYNIAQGSVTVGTSSRTISMLVPGGGVLDAVFPMPLGFSTAITVAATTTLTGSSAPSTGLVTNIYYK